MERYRQTLRSLGSDEPDYRRIHREVLALLAAIDKDPTQLMSWPADWRFTNREQTEAKIRQGLKDIAKRRAVKLILYLRANYRHLSSSDARVDTGEIEFLMKAEGLFYDELDVTPQITPSELRQLSRGNQSGAIRY